MSDERHALERELAELRRRKALIEKIGDVLIAHMQDGVRAYVATLAAQGYSDDEITGAVNVWHNEILLPWCRDELTPFLQQFAELPSDDVPEGR